MSEMVDLAREDLQGLWYALSKRPWFSLAVLPAGGDESFDACRQLAVELKALAELHRGTSVRLIVEESPRLPEANELAQEIRAEGQSARSVIIALPSVVGHQAGVALARAADAAILGVTLGLTAKKDAQTTVDRVGRERVVGAVTFPRVAPLQPAPRS